MAESVERLIGQVVELEKKISPTVEPSIQPSKSADGVATERLSTELDVIGRDIKTQLDDVHDMVANMEEKAVSLLEQINTDLKGHDNRTVAVSSKLGQLLRAMNDDFKENFEKVGVLYYVGSVMYVI